MVLVTEEERYNGYLQALEIGHYVWGGFGCLWGCLGGVMFVSGVIVFNDPVARAKNPTGSPGYGLIVMGLIFMFVFLSVGILNIVSGYKIRQRKGKVLTLVMASFNCLSIPFGLTLAIFTFVILSKDVVKRMYGIAPAIKYRAPHPPKNGLAAASQSHVALRCQHCRAYVVRPSRNTTHISCPHCNKMTELTESDT